MGIDSISAESWQVLVAFGLYLVGVVTLGLLSHFYLKKQSFVASYFLGDRGLGAWVLALTVAATAISGGSFMGFPSLIYSNGWIMALWICSYMVVPLTTMALMGKRINQVARLSGSVTMPDVLRDRFASPALGIFASLIILYCLVFNLVAQFKAGALVMQEAMDLPKLEVKGVERLEKVGMELALTLDLGGETVVQKIAMPENFENPRAEVDTTKGRVKVSFVVDGQRLMKSVAFPAATVRVPVLGWSVEVGYLIGLIIFALTVVAYTTYGGYWAVTLTDLLAGLVMLTGVIVLAILAMREVRPINGLTGLAAATEHLRQITPPGGHKGDLVFGPGPKEYLPLGLAFSFFLMWSLMSPGQPSGMVRLMSFKDSPSLRRALLLIACYFILIYVSLLIIFICARALFPTQYLGDLGSEGQPDSIMPVMARRLAHPVVAGFLMAAPYAAIMSTVAAFLLMISSSLVRDLYQRTINPHASQKTLRRASYAVTGLVGLVVMLGAIRPPAFLQQLIVFTGSGQGCAFLIPVLLALYWKRATRQGVLAGMLGGFLAVIAMYILGWVDRGWVRFEPLRLGEVDPLIWGLLASLVLTVGVSLATKPDPELVKKYFP
jgi:sodium/pantothenate symporter